MINATLIGRLTADPVERQDRNGKTIASFTLACQRNKDTADFVKCSAFGQSAAVALDFLKKGHQTCVVGRLELSSYENKEGVEQKNLQCTVTSLCLLSNSKKEDAEGEDKPKRKKPAQKPTEEAQEFNPYA